MAKIQKAIASSYLAKESKWSQIWKFNDYFLPENETVFKEIYEYFKKSLAEGKCHLDTYLNWMVDKGALTIRGMEIQVKPDGGYYDEDGKMTFDKYEMHRDMWSKFSDWLHHCELKRNAAQNIERESIEQLAKSMTETTKKISEKVDPIIENALNNF